MTVSGSRRRPLVLRLSLTAAIAATVAGSSVAFASPAVSAPMPVRTAAAPAFTAGLCEGTEYTPSEQMLEISGIRLDHYNDGNIVPMYGTTDRGTSAAVDAPVCGVRDVDGIAKSEWMYCTDFDLDPCAGVDENGLPVDKHNDEMGATVPSSGNPDLSADDLAVISWLLQNPAKLDGVVSGNGSEDARSARQTLVWCVSDYDNPLMADFKSLCDRNIGDDERARIVEIMNVTQTLDLVRKTPATGTLKAGETAVFTLNTNMYRKPITVQSSAGTELTVCGDNAKATLSANQLTVDGRGDAPTAVDLCLTAAAGGDYSVTASVISGFGREPALEHGRRTVPDLRVVRHRSAGFDECICQRRICSSTHDDTGNEHTGNNHTGNDHTGHHDACNPGRSDRADCSDRAHRADCACSSGCTCSVAAGCNSRNSGAVGSEAGHWPPPGCHRRWCC